MSKVEVLTLMLMLYLIRRSSSAVWFDSLGYTGSVQAKPEGIVRSVYINKPRPHPIQYHRRYYPTDSRSNCYFSKRISLS